MTFICSHKQINNKPVRFSSLVCAVIHRLVISCSNGQRQDSYSPLDNSHRAVQRKSVDLRMGADRCCVEVHENSVGAREQKVVGAMMHMHATVPVSVEGMDLVSEFQGILTDQH